MHNFIIFPQQSAKFQFLYQLDPSICTWDHTCLCQHPSEEDNLIEFYFRESICPRLRPKYLMYYQPAIWLGNPSVSMIHFLMRSCGLAKFLNKMFYKIKNDPQVEFGMFLFKLIEQIENGVCKYIFIVCTDVYIWGTHFIKTHELVVTDTTPNQYDQWLQLYSSETDEYLQTVNQEHIVELN